MVKRFLGMNRLLSHKFLYSSSRRNNLKKIFAKLKKPSSLPHKFHKSATKFHKSAIKFHKFPTKLHRFPTKNIKLTVTIQSSCELLQKRLFDYEKISQCSNHVIKILNKKLTKYKNDSFDKVFQAAIVNLYCSLCE